MDVKAYSEESWHGQRFVSNVVLQNTRQQISRKTNDRINPELSFKAKNNELSVFKLWMYYEKTRFPGNDKPVGRS